MDRGVTEFEICHREEFAQHRIEKQENKTPSLTVMGIDYFIYP